MRVLVQWSRGVYEVATWCSVSPRMCTSKSPPYDLLLTTHYSLLTSIIHEYELFARSHWLIQGISSPMW